MDYYFLIRKPKEAPTRWRRLESAACDAWGEMLTRCSGEGEQPGQGTAGNWGELGGTGGLFGGPGEPDEYLNLQPAALALTGCTGCCFGRGSAAHWTAASDWQLEKFCCLIWLRPWFWLPMPTANMPAKHGNKMVKIVKTAPKIILHRYLSKSWITDWTKINCVFCALSFTSSHWVLLDWQRGLAEYVPTLLFYHLITIPSTSRVDVS